MKKKYFIKIFIFIFLIILSTENVLAEKINCIYDEYKDIKRPFLLQYDTKLKKYELGLQLEGEKKEDKEYIEKNGYIYELGKYEIGSNFIGKEEYHLYINEKPVKEIKKGQSLNLYYCFTEYTGGGPNSTGTTQIYIFSDSLQKEKKEREGSLPQKIEKCFKFESNEVKSGESEAVDECKTFDNIAKEVEDGFKEYNTISGANKASNNITKLKELCNSITSYEDFDDNCIKSCFILSDWLQEKKKEYGIIDNSINKSCGFSERLLSFFVNILRWVKYILPAIVIVLGILDFIKAMGSDKEDEMKKAQGRFIKRLIAAALVFIVPLILEFVLDKMGFGYDSCGLF